MYHSTLLIFSATLKNTTVVINETSNFWLDFVNKQAQGDLLLDVALEMNNLTLDIIGKAAFSEDLHAIEGKQQKQKQMFAGVVSGLIYFLSLGTMLARFLSWQNWTAYQRWKKALKESQDEGNRMIENRRKQTGQEKKSDFLEFLLEEKDPK
jgi:cytochrome P450